MGISLGIQEPGKWGRTGLTVLAKIPEVVITVHLGCELILKLMTVS